MFERRDEYFLIVNIAYNILTHKFIHVQTSKYFHLKQMWARERQYLVWQFSAFTVRLSTNYLESQRIIFEFFFALFLSCWQKHTRFIVIKSIYSNCKESTEKWMNTKFQKQLKRMCSAFWHWEHTKTVCLFIRQRCEIAQVFFFYTPNIPNMHRIVSFSSSLLAR